MPKLNGAGAVRLVFLVLCVLATGCTSFYPEIIVVNEIGEKVLVRQLSFNGCLWEETLAFGEASSPGRCLSGEDRVHFRRIDLDTYCREQVDEGTIDGLCHCDPDDAPPEDPLDLGLVDETPYWFAYQTVRSFSVDSGELRIITLTRDEIEQDFDVPGPYGH